MASRARHVTGCVSTAECLMIPGEVEEQTFRPEWRRRAEGLCRGAPPLPPRVGKDRFQARPPGGWVAARVGRQGACSGPWSLPSLFRGRGPPLEGPLHGTGFAVKRCGGQCAWEQQVEAPMSGPKKGRPDGVLLSFSLPQGAVLGQGKQACQCPPRGQSQGNAKEAGFNSEPRCQLLFPGASMCEEIYPCLLICSPQQSQQGRGQREVESQRAQGTCLQLICWEVAGPHGGCLCPQEKRTFCDGMVVHGRARSMTICWLGGFLQPWSRQNPDLEDPFLPKTAALTPPLIGV